MAKYTLLERPNCSLDDAQLETVCRRWVEAASQQEIAREIGTHIGNVRSSLMLRFHMRPRSPWFWQSTGAAAHLRRRMELTRIPRSAPGIPDPADYMPLSKLVDVGQDGYYCADGCHEVCPDCLAAAQEAEQFELDAFY